MKGGGRKMTKINVEVKEQKGPLGFGTQYTAEASEQSFCGISINQERATNSTVKHAVADAVGKFMDNKERK